MKIISLRKLYLTVLCTLILPFGAQAATISDATNDEDVYVSDNKLERVSVKWIEPKSFTDVKEPNFSSARFRKHVFSQLEKHLDELAKALPEGQSLNVTVTDVDLAGSIEFASFIGLRTMDDIRIMRNVDIPRLQFMYELVDANGQVIKTEEVSLKDMNYLNDMSMRGRDRPFEHEKRMLSRWFAKSII